MLAHAPVRISRGLNFFQGELIVTEEAIGFISTGDEHIDASCPVDRSER